MSHELMDIKKEPKQVNVQELKDKFPSRKRAITQGLVDEINRYAMDPLYDGYQFVDSMVDNQNAMIKNSASMSEYANAIRFSAFLLAGDSSVDAYKKTFAEREFVKNSVIAGNSKGTDCIEYRTLLSAATRYKNSPIVTDILKMAMIPTEIRYMGARDEALGVLMDKMHNSMLDKDAIAAADTLLRHTKDFQEIKMELDIGVKETNSRTLVLEQIAQAALRQKGEIDSGIELNEAQRLGLRKVSEDVEEAELVDDDG